MRRTPTLSIGISVVAVFLIVAVAATGNAAEQDMISTNPVLLFFNMGSLSYEHAYSNGRGIAIGVAGNIFGKGKVSETEFEITQVELCYRRYWGKNGPFTGSWSGIDVGYSVADFWQEDGVGYALDVKTVFVIGGGGYRFRTGPMVYGLFLGYGVSFEFSSGEEYRSPDRTPFGGIVAGLTIGMAISR